MAVDLQKNDAFNFFLQVYYVISYKLVKKRKIKYINF